MINAGLFSSKTDLWETPQDFFDELDEEFHFDLDVCALPENAKCENYYTPEDNGLDQPWRGTVWCNPPYGRQIGEWVQKAEFWTFLGIADTVVMLLPARTDTKWFHRYIYTAMFGWQVKINYTRVKTIQSWAILKPPGLDTAGGKIVDGRLQGLHLEGDRRRFCLSAENTL